MAVINDLTLTRTDANTIQVDTAYYDLNTKANQLVEDLVDFVEDAMDDVVAYVPPQIESLFNTEMGDTYYNRTEIDALVETLDESTLASLGAQGAMYDPVSESWTRLGSTANACQELMRGCVRNRDDEIMYFLNPSDWSYKYAWAWDTNLTYGVGAYVTVSGTTYKAILSGKGQSPTTATTYWATTTDVPSTILASTDGTDGGVYIAIPACYTARYNASGKSYFWCSTAILPGMTIDPAFMPGGEEVKYRFIGAYESVLYDASVGAFVDGTGDSDTSALVDFTNDYLAPVSGHKPWTGLTRSEDRILHSNWSSMANSEDYVFRNDLLRQLFTCEFATWDSQTEIEGHTEDTGVYANVSETGLCDYLGNGSGSYKPSTLVLSNKWRGIENFFGDVYEWIDGFNVNNFKPYITYDPTNCADDIDDSNASYDYVQAADQNGNVILLPESSGYQKYLGPGTFLPVSVGGSDSTYITDYVYTATGWRVLRLGGGLSNGRQAGFGGLYAYDGAGLAGWNIAGRSALA